MLFRSWSGGGLGPFTYIAGSGGAAGSAGATGSQGSQGSQGPCVSGNSNITAYIGTGTRNGPIS